MLGLKIAVLFGLYPNLLGFCGSQKSSDKDILSRWLSGERISIQKIKKIIRGFEGAFPYYKLIASSNNIKDPFDAKVICAYWIGNNLLENVSIIDLRKMIAKEFSKRGLLGKYAAEKKAKAIPYASIPHHSFHVLVIGSVTGRVELKGKLLDLCRISWGEVLNDTKREKNAIIECRPLQKKNRKYIIGKAKQKTVFLDKNFIPNVKVGDIVAVHWNHVVKVIGRKDASLLKKYTQSTINSLE